MDQQSSSLDLRYYFHALLNGRWIIIAAMLLAMALAAISNYFQTLQYQSVAQIQIDAPPFLPNPGADLSAQSNYYLNIDRYFKTEKEKLNSRRMHSIFIQKLQEKDARYRSVPAESIARELEVGLKIYPVEDTNLVAVEFKTDNPQKAADWLNMYVDLFVAENMRVQEENVKQNREILHKQLDEIKNLLSSQQGQMVQYAGSIGGGGAENGAADAGESLYRFQANYDDARGKRTEEEQKLNRLKPYMLPGSDLNNMPPFDFAPSIRAIYDRLTAASTELAKLRREGKGEQHRLVVAKRSEIQSIEEQLRGETKKIADSLEGSVNSLKAIEQAALKTYNAKLAERKASSRQIQEMNRLDKMRDTWTNASTLVEDKLRSLKVLESFVSNNMNVVERGQPNMVPVSQRGKIFVLLIGIAGMVIGSGIVIAGEILNPKVKSVEEIQSSFNVPALGFLPSANDFSLGQIRESYNVLRTELLFRRDMHQHRSVMITSSLPQEGKTTVTMNLAKTLAAAGDKTVVLDFDLRKARLRSLMSSGSQNGDTVFSPVEGLNLRLEPTETKTLHLIVPATLPQNPPSLLSQPEIRDLIEHLRSRYDWVLIDTPPVASVTDPVIIASLVDTVLFVIKYNFVDKRLVKNSIGALAKVNADIMGGVLNNLDVRKMNYYSYQSYYRYYSDSDSK
jgi:polysaccharide biosynthesis transport protein